MAAPSGIAASPSGEMIVSIDSRFGAVRHRGLFRFRTSDGKSLPGIDLDYSPGDLDVDAKGWMYVVDKLTAQWRLYNADGMEAPGSPYGENDGLHIQRGISVLPDSSRVYTISESAANISVWERNACPESTGYTKTGILIDHLSYQSGAVDILPDGTVLVSCNEEGMVLALNDRGEISGLITGEIYR